MTRLSLSAVNPDVVAIHTVGGLHVGNLKHIGSCWKFKAVGYEPGGAVVPGGGPLTGQHNMVLPGPDPQVVNALLGPCLG
ncbi:MAG: hypothetical protein R3E42_15690 [Burkholderiaceae bacterium]